MRCRISKTNPLGGGIYQHIQNLKLLDRVAFCSRVILLTLTTLIFFPPALSLMDTTAAPTPSTTSLTLSTSDISVEIAPGNSAGTFVASDPATVSVTTNNYSGYTLGITSSDNVNNTKLTNTNDNTAYLTSISSASAPADFNANNWGYLPSKLNGTANSAYQPAPTTTATTLEATNAANPTANEYTIALGAKADYTLPEGTYENTFTITAVANPVSYTVTYNKNTEDAVTDFPTNQAGDVGSTDVYVPSITPGRDHYTFLGWCDTTPTNNNGVDSCGSTTYQSGAKIPLSQTTANNITLHAMWKIDTFTCFIQTRDQAANGSYGGYTTRVNSTLNYGQTCAYNIAADGTFKAISYSVPITENISQSFNRDRQTYTLTVSRNTSYIPSASGGGTKRAGEVVTISTSENTCSKFSGWTQTAGTAGTFGNKNSTSTTFTMPTSNATVYANGVATSTPCMQNYTTSNCPTSRTLVYDSRDNRGYYIQKIGGVCWMTSNLNIAGGTTLTSLKSNVSSNYTLPTSSTSGFTDPSTAYVYNSSNYGGYYSFKAATVGLNPSSGAAAYDICPKGWKIATADNYRSIIASYSNISTSPWYVVPNGNYDNSRLDWGGTWGYYWASAGSEATRAYYLYMGAGGSGSVVGTENKRCGFGIRCVAK